MHWLSRPYIAADTETAIGTGRRPVPPLVCWAESDGQKPRLYHHKDAREPIGTALENAAGGRCNLVFHNLLFDLPVLMAYDRRFIRPIYAALDNDAIIDTMFVQRTLDLWHGNQPKSEKSLKALADLSDLYLDLQMSKGDDTWRTRYGYLWHVPLSQWPREAVEYAELDPKLTARVFHAQLQTMATGGYAPDVLAPVPHMGRTALSMKKAVGIRGMLICPDKLEALRVEKETKMAELAPALRDAGILVKDQMKVAPRRQLVIDAFGDDIPKDFITKPSLTYPDGQITYNAATLLATNNPLGIMCARYSGLKDKALGTYYKAMLEHREKNNGAMRATTFNPVLDTGRVATGLPMTMPAQGGYRECHVPRDGFEFCFVDYETAELRSLAQAVLWAIGWSTLAEVFQTPGADPHETMACTMQGLVIAALRALKKSDPKRYKLFRNMAKRPNFGFPGYMFPPTYIKNITRDLVKEFVDTDTWNGPAPTLAEGKLQREQWLATWPEQRPRFKRIDEQLSGDDIPTGRFQVPVLGLYVGNRNRNQAGNFEFQPLTAAGATSAMYEITKACYAIPESPLYGCRPVAFVHDEIGVEVIKSRKAEASAEICRIMVECMEVYTPDVKASVEPALSEFWTKGAKPVYDNQGGLTTWYPKKKWS